MNLKEKKILVTGGSGFIGTHLIKKLLGLRAIVDNFDLSLGLDIQNSKQLGMYIKKEYDVVFHLAGFSGSAISNKDQVKSFKINSLATVRLCELICNYSPKTKLVLSSSRLEYGNPQYLPVDENHATIPTSAYGLSKLAATQMAMVNHLNNDLRVTIFRTSNVYGPHPNGKFSGYNVINHFIDLATRNKTLTIYGQGEQERDYLYIDDMIEAFLLTLNSRPKGQIYNLGYGHAIKFKDMAKLIIKMIGKGKLRFVEWPTDLKDVETGSYISDISKIKKDFNFQPKVNFDEGIAKTIEQYQKYLHVPNSKNAQ